MNRNRVSDEIAGLTEKLRLNPGDAAIYSERGWIRQQQDDYEGAIKDYTNAIRLCPNNAEYYILRGGAYSRKPDRESQKLAIDDYSQAIQLGSSDPEITFQAHYFRAFLYRAIGLYDSAIKDFSHLMDLKPASSRDFQEHRGIAHMLKRDYDAAIKDFTEVINLGWYSFYLRGRCRAASGDFDGAIMDYEKAIQEDSPENRALHVIELNILRQAKMQIDAARNQISGLPPAT